MFQRAFLDAGRRVAAHHDHLIDFRIDFRLDEFLQAGVIGENIDQHRNAEQESENAANAFMLFCAFAFSFLGFGPGGDFDFWCTSHA